MSKINFSKLSAIKDKILNSKKSDNNDMEKQKVILVTVTSVLIALLLGFYAGRYFEQRQFAARRSNFMSQDVPAGQGNGRTGTNRTPMFYGTRP